VTRKIDVIRENYSMLSDEVRIQHSNTLEWVVIILIALEFGLVSGRASTDFEEQSHDGYSNVSSAGSAAHMGQVHIIKEYEVSLSFLLIIYTPVRKQKLLSIQTNMISFWTEASFWINRKPARS